MASGQTIPLAVIGDVIVDGEGNLLRRGIREPARDYSPEQLQVLYLTLREGGGAAQIAARTLFGLLSDRATAQRIAAEAVAAGAIHALLMNMHMSDADSHDIVVEDRAAWPGGLPDSIGRKLDLFFSQGPPALNNPQLSTAGCLSSFPSSAR